MMHYIKLRKSFALSVFSISVLIFASAPVFAFSVSYEGSNPSEGNSIANTIAVSENTSVAYDFFYETYFSRTANAYRGSDTYLAEPYSNAVVSVGLVSCIGCTNYNATIGITGSRIEKITGLHIIPSGHRISVRGGGGAIEKYSSNTGDVPHLDGWKQPAITGKTFSGGIGYGFDLVSSKGNNRFIKWNGLLCDTGLYFGFINMTCSTSKIYIDGTPYDRWDSGAKISNNHTALTVPLEVLTSVTFFSVFRVYVGAGAAAVAGHAYTKISFSNDQLVDSSGNPQGRFVFSDTENSEYMYKLYPTVILGFGFEIEYVFFSMFINNGGLGYSASAAF